VVVISGSLRLKPFVKVYDAKVVKKYVGFIEDVKKVLYAK